MWDAPIARIKRSNSGSSRPHKRCAQVLTVGRWTWKLSSAKECVTTHQPNLCALKMDSAEAGCLYLAVECKLYASTSRVAWRYSRRAGVNSSGNSASADLGCSSN